MSKRKIDLGDGEPVKKLNKDDSKVSDGGAGLKPGLKMNFWLWHEPRAQ